MFSGKRNDKAMNGNAPDPLNVNSIKKGTTITGEIKSDGDIRFDGKLEGDITTTGKLIIGRTGEITGNIKCKNADVEGSVEGKMIVSELLSLKATAIVKGEINTKKLAIDAGALLNGTCNMMTTDSQPSNTTAAFSSNGKKEKQAIK